MNRRPAWQLGVHCTRVERLLGETSGKRPRTPSRYAKLMSAQAVSKPCKPGLFRTLALAVESARRYMLNKLQTRKVVIAACSPCLSRSNALVPSDSLAREGVCHSAPSLVLSYKLRIRCSIPGSELHLLTGVAADIIE